ncbi:MAG: alpha/beta fold hydrolase [Chloroflexi bacterium]|nr:alpha/beta fold hydrolase [Chloroflexota bacterium]
MHIVFRVSLLVSLLSLVGMTYLLTNFSTQTVQSLLHPPHTPLTDDPGNWGMPYETVAFPSQDGTVLRGWFIPGESQAAVILTHGLWTNRQSLLPWAEMLYKRGGMSVLMFDFRAVGESEGETITFGYKERGDVLGALAYLKTRPEVDGGRIGVMGNSLGAAVALMAAGTNNEAFGAVVADSPFESLDAMVGSSFQLLTGLPRLPFGPLVVRIGEWETGLRTSEVMPVRQVANISPTPLLIIHGLQDKLVPYVQSRALFEAAQEPKELWLVAGADHVGARKVAREEYEDRVIAFFQRHLEDRPAG